MRSTVFFSAVLVLFATTSLLAQGGGAPPGAVPAGAGDKNLSVDDAKMRSVELERVKRDAEKPDTSKKKTSAPTAPATPDFQQVKQDFESIQRLQDDIVTLYSKGSSIDYGKISVDAAQLNISASRLETNLFPPIPEKKKGGKKPAESPQTQPDEQPLPTDVKSLIVEEDSHIGSFVSAPMFTSPSVIDPAANAKTHLTLQRIIRLSAALQQAADKGKK